jgi:hypothetical protein
MAITRACYATREQVRRALDIQQSAYSDSVIDRKIAMGSGAVDRLCQRKFYPRLATYKFDWPNYQYAYPWRHWLEQYELAADPATAPGGQVVSGTFLSTPIVIKPSQYILYPQDGPPFKEFQLRRDSSAGFGNNTTPQLDIGITGYFGYWINTQVVATLNGAINSTTSTTATVTPNSITDVGSTLVIDNERMLVTDNPYVSTGISPLSGATTNLASDVTIAVPDGTQFSAQEVILLDSEWMLVQHIVGNNLIVKRAYSGSVLATHSLPVIFARRQLTVTRGFLGTTAATHLNSAPVSVDVYPELVGELAIAEAVVSTIQEPQGYANQQQATWYGQTTRSQGQQRETWAGTGLMDLRGQVCELYARQVRTRVV